MSVWRPNQGTLEHLFILRLSFKIFDFPLNHVVLPFLPFLRINRYYLESQGRMACGCRRQQGVRAVLTYPGLQHAVCRAVTSSGECGLQTQGQGPRDSWSQDGRATFPASLCLMPWPGAPLLLDTPWVPFLDSASQRTPMLPEGPGDSGSHPAWPKGLTPCGLLNPLGS